MGFAQNDHVTARLTPQHNELMSERRVLRFNPAPRLKWRSQDGQDEAEQSAHRTQVRRSCARSTRIIFSVPTTGFKSPHGYLFEIAIFVVSSSRFFRAGLTMAENKRARILAAVLFQISQYALIRQIYFPRMLPVAAPYFDQSFQYAVRLGFNRQLTS